MSFRSGVQDQVSSLGIKNISVNSIRVNPANFYAQGADEEEMVAQMEELLKSGQSSNVLVYEDLEPEDGKRYTLISGERRYKAMVQLMNHGESDGMISAKVVEKPNSKEDEMLQLISGNAQRAKSSEIRRKEIQTLQGIWQERKKRKETSGRFVEWAGALTGMSARSVATYLKESEMIMEDSESGESEVYDPVKAAKDALQGRLNELSEALTEAYPHADKIKIAPSMTVTIKCSEIGPLEQLIDDLGLMDVYQNGFNEDLPDLVTQYLDERDSKKRGKKD